MRAGKRSTTGTPNAGKTQPIRPVNLSTAHCLSSSSGRSSAYRHLREHPLQCRKPFARLSRWQRVETTDHVSDCSEDEESSTGTDFQGILPPSSHCLAAAHPALIAPSEFLR